MSQSETSRRRQSARTAEPAAFAQDERLYNQILDAILNRRLNPGLKLREGGSSGG